MHVGVCCAIGSCLNPLSKVQMETWFDDLVMEKKEEPLRFFARVDHSVGVLGSLGVHMPVEDEPQDG